MKIFDRAQPYVQALENRELTIRKLAGMLGCSESRLSRVLSGHLKRVQSTTKTRQLRTKLLESRREMRKKHAILVKSKQKSLKRAAADAKCSERTMRRYIGALED